MPYAGNRTVEISFDFLDHVLRIDNCDGAGTTFTLEPMTVAEFYRRVMAALSELGVTAIP